MKGIVDRIEDGETAVITIEGGGIIYVPVEKFGFDLYEGAHLDIKFTHNKMSEKEMSQDIKNLQQELMDNQDEEK